MAEKLQTELIKVASAPLGRINSGAAKIKLGFERPTSRVSTRQ